MQEVFWNPHGKSISKLSLGNQFDQDLKEKMGKTKCPFSYDFYCTPWVLGDHKVIWTWPGTRLDSIPSGGFCDSDVMHHRILSFLCKTTIFCDTKGSFESKKLSQCLTFIVKYHETFLLYDTILWMIIVWVVQVYFNSFFCIFRIVNNLLGLTQF